MPRGVPSVWTKADLVMLRDAITDRCMLGQILLRLKGKFSADVVKRKMVSEGLQRTRGMAVVPWPEADVETLRKCIAEGLTASETAARLGHRYSRNSVIGRSRRAGLSFGHGLNSTAAERHDDSVAAHKFVAGRRGGRKSHQVAVKNGTKHVPRRTTADGLTRAEIDALAEPEFIGPLNTFPDDSATSPKKCRAISGDPRTGTWRCCGQPTAAPRPYCSVHSIKFVDPSGAAARAPHWLVSSGAMPKVFG